MSEAELARLFIEGQAAKLVSATSALGQSDDATYRAAQEQRIALASAVLGAVSAAEAAALIADPTDANARALVEAIAEQDLSGEVGSLLPAADSYK
jgi:hypothetical protein